MCGIAGHLDLSVQTSEEERKQIVGAMARTLQHRGPDEAGVWSSPDQGVALGQRRLSIVDLSPAGSQPMHSPCGRWTIVYNGEIYNHRELRDTLSTFGHSFRGHCDTEVLLTAVAQWGLPGAVARCNGMFAFAVWDAHEQALTLGRDRLGIKPLYWGVAGKCFVFGSELKALRAHPQFDTDIDRDVLALYFQHGYIPAPCSIYRGIRKLPPGCLLTVNGGTTRSVHAPVAYWSLQEAVERGRSEPFRGSPEQAVDALESLLGDAVRMRMLADVPVGAFLSGGIDSSTVVALMKAHGDQPPHTFTIGFEDPAYDEERYATPIARHLHVEQTVQRVSSQEARDVIPRLAEMFDEPFADSSQIPTFLVSQLAGRSVKVCLSGDGGDELFGGYSRYFHIERIWRRIGWAPAVIRRLAATAYQRLIHNGLRRRPGASLHARALSAATGYDLYDELNRHWESPAELVLGGDPRRTEYSHGREWRSHPNFFEQMMLADTTSYLPDDILTKVDRASMAVSLEARVPLLDYRIVEFAWSLPRSIKYRNGQSKWPLRELLGRHVPTQLFERPKVGFGVPIGDWLRGPLREWAEELLDERRLRDQSYLAPCPIRERWHEHLSGDCNWQYLLWDVLMFQDWLLRVDG